MYPKLEALKISMILLIFWNYLMTYFCHMLIKMTGFVVCFYEKSNYSSLNYKYFLKNYSEFLYIDRIAISKNSGHRHGLALYKKHEKYKNKKCNMCEVNIEPINTISLNFHSRFNFKKLMKKTLSHKVRYLARKDT